MRLKRQTTRALWGGIGVLAAIPPTRRNTLVFAGVMLSHYLTAIIPAELTPAGDWGRTCELIPGFLDGWLATCIAVNILVWGLFVTRRSGATRSPVPDISAGGRTGAT